MFAASAAFSATNRPATTGVSEPPPAERVSLQRGYKALVVMFMAGGADTFNLLIPHSNCDARDVATQYTQTRGPVALAMNTLLPIELNVSQRGTQVCDTFALHPNAPLLQQLWVDNEASFVANIGPLVEPLNKQQYLDKQKVQFLITGSKHRAPLVLVSLVHAVMALLPCTLVTRVLVLRGRRCPRGCLRTTCRRKVLRRCSRNRPPA
jgi:cullin-associated NEDD8-dissociated protein 1